MQAEPDASTNNYGSATDLMKTKEIRNQFNRLLTYSNGLAVPTYKTMNIMISKITSVEK